MVKCVQYRDERGGSRKVRILYVDDPALTRMTEVLLVGIEVIGARTPDEGLRKAVELNWQFDAIVISFSHPAGAVRLGQSAEEHGFEKHRIIVMSITSEAAQAAQVNGWAFIPKSGSSEYGHLDAYLKSLGEKSGG